jgi:hypothetical protein
MLSLYRLSPSRTVPSRSGFGLPAARNCRGSANALAGSVAVHSSLQSSDPSGSAAGHLTRYS